MCTNTRVQNEDSKLYWGCTKKSFFNGIIPFSSIVLTNFILLLNCSHFVYIFVLINKPVLKCMLLLKLTINCVHHKCFLTDTHNYTKNATNIFQKWGNVMLKCTFPHFWKILVAFLCSCVCLWENIYSVVEIQFIKKL